MKLVDPKDISNAAKLYGLGGKGTAKLLMRILGYDKLNRHYSLLSNKNGIDFIDATIEELGIRYEFNEEELKRIPANGAFITISNHPFGGIDGILILKILSMVRPDYKVMANFILRRIKPIKDYFLPVNPFEGTRVTTSSLSGIKYAINHLKDGYPLGIFPAGEVSTYNSEKNRITDKQWLYSAIKFIKKSHVPIVPIYFQGNNSRFFHLLGLIHPILRTVKLPSELFNKKKKIIKIRIGNPISIKDQDEFTDISRYGRFLRAKTYALGTPLEVTKFFRMTIKRSLVRAEKIAEPVSVTTIQDELKRLSDYVLFKSKNYVVYCAPSIEMPHILHEIGRLREETFRHVGEGTNRSMDIDEFDLYYHQLFIWDTDTKSIVGAYRVGKGKDILIQYGIKGFYTQSLFRINKQFQNILNESIELGRSFIVPEYQKKILPLFLLWKGILYFLLKHPEYRYLFGPVSISSRYSKFSKALLIEFIKSHYFNYRLASYIKPRKKFKVNASSDADIILENTHNDLNKLDKVIEDIEPTNYKMPVLLKKYIKLNAKIIGFNIDPKFNNALDGLMILDLFEVPMNIIESLSKEINDETILERFYTHELENINIPQMGVE